MADEDDLLSAVQKNDAARVRAILDRNPLILRARTPNGTLVLTAAYYGAGDALKLLLERTPEDALNAYEAATTGNARRLKTILGQSRKRINDANEEGFTPLGLAAFFGHVDAVVAGDHTDVVRVLLAAGADPNVRSEASYTTLHKAAVHGNLDIVRMLVDRGADVKATRDGGHTPLEDAREKGHEAIVEFLEAREGTA